MSYLGNGLSQKLYIIISWTPKSAKHTLGAPSQSITKSRETENTAVAGWYSYSGLHQGKQRKVKSQECRVGIVHWGMLRDFEKVWSNFALFFLTVWHIF